MRIYKIVVSLFIVVSILCHKSSQSSETICNVTSISKIAPNINLSNLLWRFDLGENLSTPAFTIEDNKIFVGNESGILYAIDALNGKKIWEFKTGGPIYVKPVVKNNVVYFSSYDGNFYAVYIKSGKEKWKFPVGEELKCIPAIEDELVFFNHKRTIYALDVETGLDMWKSECHVSGSSIPIIFMGTLYFYNDLIITAIEVKTGKILWKYTLPIFRISDLLIKDSLVHFMTKDNIYCLQNTDGKLKWNYKFENDTDPEYLNTPTIDDETLYYSVFTNIYAFNIKNGEVKWIHKSKAKSHLGEIAISNDVIYFTDKTNTIFTIRKHDGKKPDKFESTDKIASSQLEAINDIVYFINSHGELCAFRVIKF